MPNPLSSHQAWLSTLEEHLNKERYSSSTAGHHLAAVQNFLAFLDKQRIAVSAVQPATVERYLKIAHGRYRRLQGHPPPQYKRWRRTHTDGIHMLLRLVQGQWPPVPIPATAFGLFRREISEAYVGWLTDFRGLAPETVSDRRDEAHRFLDWMGERLTREALAAISVADVDTYMKNRAGSMRRVSIKLVATNLRSFLRWLHATGRTPRDLSKVVVAPVLYALESIPSALRPQDVGKILSMAQRDGTPKGVRDFAILTLLANYGVRAGEIASLRLDDVDWRKEVIRIRHRKTGVTSYLPLLPEVGDAILAYLQKARPKVAFRELFIRNLAPYRPFTNGSSLYALIRCRIDAAGVPAGGKRGPHAFRHARAVSLIRASVPLKEIGDVLGHRASDSTLVYLKLATEDLRAVALEIPGEVKAVKSASSVESSPRDYVRQMNLRNPITARVYRCILNGFQRFVTEQSQDQSVSRETICLWLNDRIRVWPFHLVTHRARLVDRFLDWAVKRGALDQNPFTGLRSEYGQRSTTPIVRALLNPNSGGALNALRPVPRFGSFLGPVMLEHIALMKAMGCRYDKPAKNMLRLDRFLQTRPDLSGQPLTVVIREWTNSGSTAQHAYQCHETGRALSRALSRIDPAVETIRSDKRIGQVARNGYRQPYIFSEQEIRSLLEAAQSFPSPRCPLRPQTLHTMLVLAYCSGLRIGEIVGLNLGDVDLEDRAIEIRQTKFFKSRRLPLSNSEAATLQSYLVARLKAGAPTESSAGLFWHEQPPGRYSTVVAGQMLARVLRRAGIKREKGRVGPRIHDLRHAFVCHRMLAWYREGVHPQSRLPYLATYLGHKDINSTLVYLTITQELMQHASERFRRYGASTLAAPTGGAQ